MLGSLDPAKVLVILVVALVVLGPERLPRAARQLGAAWRELTRLRDQVSEEVRSAIPELDLPRVPPGSVSGFLRDLTTPSGSGAGVGAAGSETDLAGESRWHQATAGEAAHGAIPPRRGGQRAARGPAPVLAPDDPAMN